MVEQKLAWFDSKGDVHQTRDEAVIAELVDHAWDPTYPATWLPIVDLIMRWVFYNQETVQEITNDGKAS